MSLAVVRQEEMPSPARAALAERLATLRDAVAKRAHARIPVQRLLSQLEAAQAALRVAQDDLAAIAERETEDLRVWSQTGDNTDQPQPRRKERAGAQRKVDTAHQAVENLGHALHRLQPDVDEAQRVVKMNEDQLDVALLDVISDEHATARAELERAWRAFAVAEAAFRGLTHAVFEHAKQLNAAGISDAYTRWLAAGNKFIEASGAMQRPELTIAEFRAQAARWAALIETLRTDPAATVE